jgi:hypothetical protein
LLSSACTERPRPDEGIVITEASGITRGGDRLLIVGDDADGVYFEIEIERNAGPVIPIDPLKVREIRLPNAALATDLEGIDILADGRIAILSEQTRCLVTADTDAADCRPITAEYDRTLTEFGHRGLEGLAVSGRSDGSSLVAVLWEGGYPLREDLPLELMDNVAGIPMKPVIVIHELEPMAQCGKIDKPLQRIILNVPEPEGSPPDAQRFRATDLVWYRPDPSNGDPSELIVILNSENSPADPSQTPVEYKLKILQRFNLDGEPIGKPIDINDVCRAALDGLDKKDYARMGEAMAAHIKSIHTLLEAKNWENINWEGLGWYERDRRLIAIYDGVPKDPPFALIITIPEEWR